MEEKIEEILRNRVLDITDEYKGTKREEGIQVYLGYPKQLIDELTALLSQSKKDVIEVLKKQLPKEQGFNDYSKHVHTYVTENRGNCGICGLSWKKTTEYGCYNTALREVKKILKIYLLSLKDK